MLKITQTFLGLTEALQVPPRDTSDILLAHIRRRKANSKAFVISAYPRYSSDLVHYNDRLDGVILINWHDAAIKSQIEYGAQTGQIKLDTAKTEWRHYKRHVIPVAEYFDVKQMLYVVSTNEMTYF